MLAPRLPAAGDEAESPDVAERIEAVAKTEPSFLPRADYVRATQSNGMTVASREKIRSRPTRRRRARPPPPLRGGGATLFGSLV